MTSPPGRPPGVPPSGGLPALDALGVRPIRRAAARTTRVDDRTPSDGQQSGEDNSLLPYADCPAQLIGITGQVRAEQGDARRSPGLALLISRATLTSDPSASPSQRRTSRWAAAVMCGPKPVTARLENTGWASRRCRRHCSPSLVSSPLPTSARSGR